MGWYGGRTKFNLVKLVTICIPLSSNSLGIRRLIFFNEALLGKWLWCYSLERDSLFKRVIEVKYGVSLWRTIRRGWSSL